MFDALKGVADSLIAGTALLFVAYLTFVLNKRMQIEAEWRTQKLSLYREFLDALVGNIEGETTEESHKRFARASNNLLLIASKNVLVAHHAYRDQIAIANTNRDYDLDAPLLAGLLNALRADLNMLSGYMISPEQVRLWAAGKPTPRK